MKTLRKGSSGPDVEGLQGQLHRLGYEPGRIDGEFGPKTRSAVIAFRKASGLEPDGIVGLHMRRALDDRLQEFLDEGELAPDPTAPPSIDRTLRLYPDQYYRRRHAKDLIVLHHTSGGSAASTVSWWNSNPSHVAAPYIVERDGTIHEVFDPEYWAYHLGLRGTGGSIDRRSIGIEIANEGGLLEHGGKHYRFDRILKSHEFNGSLYRHPANWRGYRSYAAYTPEQIDAVIRLTDYLLDRFRIPRKTPVRHDAYDASLQSFSGVLGHHHLRLDKSDVHPGFPWGRLVGECGLGVVG